MKPSKQLLQQARAKAKATFKTKRNKFNEINKVNS